MNLQVILQRISCPYTTWGNLDIEIHRVAPIHEADTGTITFCDFPGISNRKRRPLDIIDEIPEFTQDQMIQSQEKIKTSRASAIICPTSLQRVCSGITSSTLIFVDNPRLAFIEVAKLFSSIFLGGIHPSAIIEPSAKIDPSSYIGPFAYVGNNCEVGSHCCLHGHTHIHPKTVIGKDVTIHAGTIIGADGFGMWRTSSGNLIKFPQLGRVIIEDRVEIQANTCVDRGALGDTIIGEGSKIDNLVHIAHNCKIGKSCAIVALAMIGGSVEMGDCVWVGPSASILNGLRLGKDCVVGMGAVVIDDVPPNVVVAGVPAKQIKKAET